MCAQFSAGEPVPGWFGINGLFPAVPGYDQATGVGTPKMTQLITGLF